ncbi:MAG TPA: hypothetical protein PKW35_04460, partial [Nannocystaceae bacterium]|nr:hypothetical protein [Nannocystaceae bacterium]
AAHQSTAADIPAAPTSSTSPASPQGVARPEIAECPTPASTDINPSDDLPEAEASPSAPTPAGVAPPCASDHPGTETSPSAPSPARAVPPSASDPPGAPGHTPLDPTSLDPLVDHPRAPTDAPATSAVVATDPDPDPIAIIHQADEAMADGDHLRAAALFAVVEDLARPAYHATGNADGAAAFLVSILRGAAEAHLKRAALADALPKSQESFALAAQLHDDEPSPVSLADLAASARVHADVLRACGRPHDAAGLIDDILLLATRARPRLHSEDLRHELKCILALRRDLERDPHPTHDAHH